MTAICGNPKCVCADGRYVQRQTLRDYIISEIEREVQWLKDISGPSGMRNSQASSMGLARNSVRQEVLDFIKGIEGMHVNRVMEVEDEQVWYELEYSRVGDNDWYASAITADTEEQAKRQMGEAATAATGHAVDGYEYRVVRKRLTAEVVA